MFYGSERDTFPIWLYNPDPEEALIKQHALSLSREAYVVADESKFSEIAFAKIADLHQATIITNELDPDTQEQYPK